eukprot:SAG25_NODE_13446_length_267_cov_0.613095_1_plen_26_part_10
MPASGDGADGPSPLILTRRFAHFRGL